MISKEIEAKLKSNVRPKFEVFIITERGGFRYAVVLQHENDVIPLKVSRLYEDEDGAKYGASVIERHFIRLIEA